VPVTVPPLPAPVPVNPALASKLTWIPPPPPPLPPAPAPPPSGCKVSPEPPQLNRTTGSKLAIANRACRGIEPSFIVKQRHWTAAAWALQVLVSAW